MMRANLYKMWSRSDINKLLRVISIILNVKATHPTQNSVSAPAFSPRNYFLSYFNLRKGASFNESQTFYDPNLHEKVIQHTFQLEAILLLDMFEKKANIILTKTFPHGNIINFCQVTFPYGSIFVTIMFLFKIQNMNFYCCYVSPQNT